MFGGSTDQGRRPPTLGTPGGKPAAPKAVAVTETVETMEAPAAGGEVPPNPAAVGYRTEAETCGRCTYMEGDMCTHPIVAQQVSAGDSCAVFEAKSGGGEMGAEPMEAPMESESEYA